MSSDRLRHRIPTNCPRCRYYAAVTLQLIDGALHYRCPRCDHAWHLIQPTRGRIEPSDLPSDARPFESAGGAQPPTLRMRASDTRHA
jgi:hypothetical protein